MKSAVITIRPKDEEGFVSLNLLKISTKIIPKIIGGKWSITVSMETETSIIQNTTNLDKKYD